MMKPESMSSGRSTVPVPVPVPVPCPLLARGEPYGEVQYSRTCGTSVQW